ncbi:serum paraoxonase/lactonase 3-like isoform X2 [Babylonia areolata]|uniref:serum paraoxonase/lactonase 3-like isoform X2 n=1 Tax=Babylonia areolata TaxID=304850 RepID=UPI003FCF3ED4
MGAIVKAVAAVLLAICVRRVLRIYNICGGFANYHQHHPGPCKQVEGIQLGSEDFHTLSDGQTFISSGLRYMAMTPQTREYLSQNGVRGRMYLLDLRDPSAGVRELEIITSGLFSTYTFVPHGISVWEDEVTGRHVLFVVNHRYQEGPIDSRVEKFIYDADRQALVHVATFSDPSMMVVNDILATGENSFYFTNCNYFRTMPWAVLELLLELRLTNVVHYDGHSYTVVDGGLTSANGVAMSSDHKTVYVADMAAREILVYRRNSNNTLARTQVYPIYTWPDNIHVDQTTGNLYVACSPMVYMFFRHMEDLGSQKSPSQVLHLEVKNGAITSSQELMYDHGKLVSASSSAVIFEGTLLIGSVCDHLVTCQVDIPLLP